MVLYLVQSIEECNMNNHKVAAHLLLLPLLFIFPPAIHALDIHLSVVQKARDFVGSSYCRGGTVPPCFDCSGFVGYILRPIVSDLPRTSREMAKYGIHIRREELLPGDLVFFATTSSGNTISHVAIYIGQDSIIHSISDGPDRGVHITSLSSRYWRDHFHSAARVLAADRSADTTEPEPNTFPGKTAAAVQFAKGLYSGDLKSGEPHGNGTLELYNGDTYRGQFLSGLFHGQGEYTWKNGAVYRGSFQKGEIHGEGTYISAQGERKEGSWESGTFLTYMQQENSPWDTWNGYITGDFDAWKQQEQQSFEQWKKENSP